MLEIKLEVSKTLLRQGATVAEVEQQLAPNIAKALALAIKGRVSERGDLAGQRFPGYDEERHGYPVSGRYPAGRFGTKIVSIVATGQKRLRPDAKWYASSEEFHREVGVVPGSYNVTGGMWSGLSVVVYTPTLVRILFRGRSEGQSARFIDGKSRPIKCDNALKAATVIERHGVNLLALAERELAGVGHGVTLSMAAGISVQLPVKWDGQAPPSGDLFSVLSAAISGR